MTTYTLVLTILSFVIPTLFTLGVILDSYYSQYMDWLEEAITLDDTMGEMLMQESEWTADYIDDLREDATNTTHDDVHGCACDVNNVCEECSPTDWSKATRLTPEQLDENAPMARETATSCHCTGRDMCNVCWWPRDLGAPTCDVQGCDTETSGTVKYCKPCAVLIKELETPIVASNDYSAFEDDIPF